MAVRLVEPVTAASPQFGDEPNFAAIIPASIDLPVEYNLATSGHFIPFGTGPPPRDFVITLQRLLI